VAGDGVTTICNGIVADGGLYVAGISELNGNTEINQSLFLAGVLYLGASDYPIFAGTNAANIVTTEPITSPTPMTLLSIQGEYTEAIVPGNTYGGIRLPANAGFIVNQVSADIVAGSSTTGNYVWEISDGTNTCDAPFACNLLGGVVADTTLYGTCGHFKANGNLTVALVDGGCNGSYPEMRTLNIQGFIDAGY
jgi:hypothetical protein